MRWEDERYVRLYTRNTPEWLALSWHARGLLSLILREVDRAGVLKVGKLGLKGVAVAVHAPWAEVEEPLAELLTDGCIVYREEQHALFMPNFLEAQECAQSDAARKRASRERARSVFGGTSDASEKARAVTNRDHMQSQNVTESHERSHAVTDGHSYPTRAVPSQALGEASDDAPPRKGRRKGEGQKRATPMPDDFRVTEALEAWCRERGLPDPHRELEPFRLHHEKNGSVFKSWDAAFKSWMLKAQDFARRNASRTSVAVQQAPDSGSIWKVGT